MTAHLVTRPRLVERLSRGLTGPLTLVSASAGYSKTTLISAWVEEMAARRDTTTPPLPAAWLALDQYDSDLTTFVRYVCAALHKVFAECCAKTLALLNAPRQAPLDALITTLSNELDGLPTLAALIENDTNIGDYLADELLASQPPDILTFLLKTSLLNHFCASSVSRLWEGVLPIATHACAEQVTAVHHFDFRCYVLP